MHSSVKVVHEGKRGCGYRREGHLYLRLDGSGMPCGKLPIIVEKCPCCGAGIGPARNWTWIDGDAFVRSAQKECHNGMCAACPLSGIFSIGRAGLLWIGEKYYQSTVDFMLEADEMGISRHISQVPHGFEVGMTWVFMAHRKGVPEVSSGENGIGSTITFKPAIFRAFRPDRIEIVVSEDATDKEIEGYLKRGLTPVVVKRVGEQSSFIEDEEMQE